jgi:hypothetical protein
MTIQKLSLVENALDSLEHAISHLNTLQKPPAAGTLKRIILDTSHVAELLFKERLRQIHPAFIYSDVDKYPSKKAHTITASDALQRLQKIGEVEFNDSDKSALKTIRDKRNEIEHYEFAIDEAEAKVVIGSVLSFIFRFATEEVGLDWSARRIEDPGWKRLNEYAEFYEIEKTHLIERLQVGGIPTMECPVCSNETFDTEAELCVLCGHREQLLQCKSCKADYLYSNVEYEDADLCRQCEWDDGYAAAHCERY